MQRESSEIKGQGPEGSSQWVMYRKSCVGHTMLLHMVSDAHWDKGKQGRVFWHLFFKSCTCLQIFLIWIGFEVRRHIQAPHAKEKNWIAFSIFKGKATEILGSSKTPLYCWEKLHTSDICKRKFKPAHFKLYRWSMTENYFACLKEFGFIF